MLKDGRIANVLIHVLPFAAGQAELAAEPAEYLAKLTRAVGTDCFLTAQVIGHIASDEIAGDDTLNAHRLARSRADAVQASLIGGGLPAKAIASVWDWQFMVCEPRATLWVFELTAGEDCEGRQLHGDLVAEAPPTEQGNAAPERVTKPAVAPAETQMAGGFLGEAGDHSSQASCHGGEASGHGATASGPEACPTRHGQPPVVARAAAVPPAAHPRQPDPGRSPARRAKPRPNSPSRRPRPNTARTVGTQPTRPAAGRRGRSAEPGAGPTRRADRYGRGAEHGAGPARRAGRHGRSADPAPAQPAKTATAQPGPPATAQPATAAPQAAARAEPAEHTASPPRPRPRPSRRSSRRPTTARSKMVRQAGWSSRSPRTAAIFRPGRQPGCGSCSRASMAKRGIR